MKAKSDVHHDSHRVYASQYVQYVSDRCHVDTLSHYLITISSMIEINFRLKLFLYISSVTFPSINITFPTSFQAKRPHTLTLQPPCFTTSNSNISREVYQSKERYQNKKKKVCRSFVYFRCLLFFLRHTPCLKSKRVIISLRTCVHNVFRHTFEW